MSKKIITIALVIISLMLCAFPAVMAEVSPDGSGKYQTPVTMYVFTANGGYLNVRSTPSMTERNVIGKVNFGSAVTVTGVSLTNSDWVCIRFNKNNHRTAWVLSCYLTAKKPTQSAAQQEEINRQLATYKAVDRNFDVLVKPSRSNGYVNFREDPGLGAPRITRLTKGSKLTVIGETRNWFQVSDSVTGKIGFVNKAYVTVMM